MAKRDRMAEERRTRAEDSEYDLRAMYENTRGAEVPPPTAARTRDGMSATKGERARAVRPAPRRKRGRPESAAAGRYRRRASVRTCRPSVKRARGRR